MTTRLASDPVLPEVANADGTSTVNWEGDVIEIVYAGWSDDTIVANDLANTIYDGGGVIGGRHDTDTISGGGDDEILGNDGGSASDTVDCGAGTDTVYFDQGDVLVVPTDCESQNPLQ